VSGYLLDTNSLLALLWPHHREHTRVRTWFKAHRHQHWATCPMTQAGFVRIASNPVFSSEAVTPSEALHLLKVNIAAADHAFWPDDVPLTQAVEYAGARLVGPQQVVDAYLLGLAIQRGGVLATLDRGISSLVGRDPIAAAALLIVE
jgi:uncharacterized protein